MNLAKILPALFSLLLIVSAVAFVLPETASAQFNKGLVTCDGYSGNALGECNFCDFVKMVNLIIAWLIGILFLVFAVVMVVAGFKLVMSGGNQSALDDAKKLFTNGLIGILIVFSAWLLVDTLMKGLLPNETIDGEEVGTLSKLGSSFGPWNQIECTRQRELTPHWGGVVREGADADDPTAGDITIPPGGLGNGLNEANAANALGIDNYEVIKNGQQCPEGTNFCVVSTDGCKDKNTKTCTSFEGLQPITAARTKELQAAVGSQLVITGATEIGHTEKGVCTHGNGCKMDFRTTPELNRHIEENFTRIGNNKYRDENGNVYYRHGGAQNDHWDVSFAN